MEDRTLAQVQAELEEAQADFERSRERVLRLKKELDALAVSGASHPWLGKEVFRVAERGYGRNKKQVTNRGVVAIYDPSKGHRSLRGVGGGYGIKAGTPIVIHRNGQTGWPLSEYDWNSRQHVCRWQLASGVEAATAGETEGLDPKGDSPVGEAETPK